MRRRQEDIRAELMAEVGTLVDEWLAWQEGKKAPALTEMKHAMLMLRERLERRMLEPMVTEQKVVKPAAAPRCEQCGEVMTYAFDPRGE